MIENFTNETGLSPARTKYKVSHIDHYDPPYPSFAWRDVFPIPGSHTSSSFELKSQVFGLR